MIPGVPEAWEMDLPTYAEVIAQFSGYGFPALEIDATKYPQLSAKSTELSTRFYARYCDRMIGFETLQLWQIKLQNRFDDIADEYERAFTIYAANATAMNRAVEGIHRTITSKDRRIATPDSDLNDNEDYADELAKSTVDGDNTVTGGRAVESVNENIDAYRDYEQRFLKEFENLFANVFE